MLSRPFTKIEKVFLLILVVVFLGLVYYRFIHLPVKERVTEADTTLIEEQITIERSKAELIQSMKDEVTENQETMIGVVATYDNFKSEAALLNTIFVPLAETYNYGFETPVAEDSIVRRNINISFTASDYRICRNIIQKVHDSRYRCMIRSVNISAVSNRNTDEYVSVLNSPVKCNMTVTFYETLIGAQTTAGLVMEDSKKKSDYIGLGKADFSNLERNSLETIAESIAAEQG
ncbi:hypothetical protein UYO_2095 [Lachnospiraceae bacterium JC7]|nr:hypothetical protein UYO_2095 [Lachnospiraceae bacterium JC7]